MDKEAQDATISQHSFNPFRFSFSFNRKEKMSLGNTNNNSLAEEDVSGLPRENSSVSFVEFEVDGHAVSREGAIRGTCDGPVDLRGSTTATSSKVVIFFAPN